MSSFGLEFWTTRNVEAGDGDDRERPDSEDSEGDDSDGSIFEFPGNTWAWASTGVVNSRVALSSKP